MRHKALIRRLQVSCLGLDRIDPLRLLVDDVIEALRENAMQQRFGRELLQEPLELCQYGQEPAFCTSSPMDCQCAIDAALAQPEQEPVAWMFQHDETGRMNYVSNDGVHNPTIFLEMNPRYALVCPLYTTPPQRTWVDLTDEEIAQGCKESWVTEQAWQSAVWWAEAKLKDKNDVAQKTNS